jgi:hypothetical protein
VRIKKNRLPLKRTGGIPLILMKDLFGLYHLKLKFDLEASRGLLVRRRGTRERWGQKTRLNMV